MTKIVNCNLYFSEFEWKIIESLSIDILEVCRESVKQEIRDKYEMYKVVNGVNNYEIENTRLKEENEKLKKELNKTN